MKKCNNPYKGTTVIHHHRACYSDHGHVPEYSLPRFKGEQTRPTYYLLTDNIYGLGIHDASNNICSVYNWTEFEGKKSINNIVSCILCCINAKGYYSQSYGKNHRMPEIAILVDNCSGQNKNNLLIRFLNMIKEGGFFGTATLNFYIKGHTNHYCGRAFKRIQVLHQKQNLFTFEKCCEILNVINNVEVIQMFHQNFFDLESILNDIYDRPDTKTVNINHVLHMKNIQYTLVSVKSSMVRYSQNRITRGKIPTVVHRGRE